MIKFIGGLGRSRSINGPPISPARLGTGRDARTCRCSANCGRDHFRHAGLFGGCHRLHDPTKPGFEPIHIARIGQQATVDVCTSVVKTHPARGVYALPATEQLTLRFATGTVCEAREGIRAKRFPGSSHELAGPSHRCTPQIVTDRNCLLSPPGRYNLTWVSSPTALRRGPRRR
jgi:hypothetical protein